MFQRVVAPFGGGRWYQFEELRLELSYLGSELAVIPISRFDDEVVAGRALVGLTERKSKHTVLEHKMTLKIKQVLKSRASTDQEVHEGLDLNARGEEDLKKALEVRMEAVEIALEWAKGWSRRRHRNECELLTWFVEDEEGVVRWWDTRVGEKYVSQPLFAHRDVRRLVRGWDITAAS
jgi:hypothetical protein